MADNVFPIRPEMAEFYLPELVEANIRITKVSRAIEREIRKLGMGEDDAVAVTAHAAFQVIAKRLGGSDQAAEILRSLALSKGALHPNEGPGAA